MLRKTGFPELLRDGAGGGAGGAGGAGGGAGGGGGGDPWYQSHVATLDKDTLGWLDGKKFPGVVDALKSGAQADKMARDRNVIARPDLAKLGEWKDGLEVFGYDGDVGKYGAKIKPPKMPNDAKHDAELYDAAVKSGHKRFIPPSMVEGFLQDMTDTVNARLSRVASEGLKASEDFNKAMREKLGANYDVKMELGKRAAKAFMGQDADTSAELERIFGGGEQNLKGSVRLADFFIRLGERLGEANIVTDDGASGGAASTPAAAEAELRRLENDPAWFKIFSDRRHPQNADYRQQWQKLTDIVAKDPTKINARPR